MALFCFFLFLDPYLFAFLVPSHFPCSLFEFVRVWWCPVFLHLFYLFPFLVGWVRLVFDFLFPSALCLFRLIFLGLFQKLHFLFYPIFLFHFPIFPFLFPFSPIFHFPIFLFLSFRFPLIFRWKPQVQVQQQGEEERVVLFEEILLKKV